MTNFEHIKQMDISDLAEFIIARKLKCSLEDVIIWLNKEVEERPLESCTYLMPKLYEPLPPDETPRP